MTSPIPLLLLPLPAPPSFLFFRFRGFGPCTLLWASRWGEGQGGPRGFVVVGGASVAHLGAGRVWLERWRGLGGHGPSMVAIGLYGVLVVARAVARAHLFSLGWCSLSLRRRGVGRGPIGRRGGGDGRGGGERALHDDRFKDSCRSTKYKFSSLKTEE